MEHNRQRIVVGTDGSPGGTSAVHWAAAEARRQQVRLHIVCAWYPPVMYGDAVWGVVPQLDDVNGVSAWATSVVTEAAAAVGPDLHATTEVVRGLPVDVLLKAAEDACAVVVGSRGRGPITGILLGSVGNGVAAQALCPAVIIRGDGSPAGPTDPVLVGFDGSAAGESALAFAVDHAGRLDVPVQAVTCWRPALRRGLDDLTDVWLHESRNATETHLAEHFFRWQEKFPAVALTRVLREDHPVEALTELSAHAQLVVVGAHSRRGPRASSALGSVSQGVLHHVDRPVAVVHH